MRRYVHKLLATLLCVCLLISYTPLPASAEQGSRTDATPSVGDMGWVDPVTGTATTQIKVLAVDALKLAITSDFAASIDEIRGNAAFDLKVEAVGTPPFSHAWSRAAYDENGALGESQLIEGATDAVYPLSQHVDTLENRTSYRYTVLVTDGSGASKEASVNVTVSDGYWEATLPNETSLPRVHGLSIHREAELAMAQLDDRSAAYGFLQQAAQGLKLDASAWQLELVGAPEGKSAFVGDLEVSLPLPSDVIVASGGSVKVIGIAPDGTTTVYDATVDEASSAAVFATETLGVFAVAYPSDAGRSFAIEAFAGTGGSISPDGETAFAQGATAVYTVLPDEGYVVRAVEVDGSPAELEGNAYVFKNVQADHRIEVSFSKVAPVDPERAHTVTARVEGGNGRVALDGGAPDVRVEASVLEGNSATVHFVPDDGYVIKSVTMRSGEDEAQSMNVFGSAFLISAVTADVEVVVEYQAGIAPPTPVHEVTAGSNEGGNVSPKSQNVPHAGSASLTVQPDEGFQVSSVLVNGQDRTDKLDAGGTLLLQNIVRDMRVQVVFEAIPRTFTIEASATAGGSISPVGPVEVTEGESASFTFAPESGFRLARIVVDGEVRAAVASYEFEDVRANHSIQAVFERIPVDPPAPTYVTVRALAGEGGSISPAGELILPEGATQTFYFLPEEGKRVSELTVDGRTFAFSGFSYTLFNINADTALSVSFADDDPDRPTPVPTTYTVSASAGEHGSVWPAGDTRVIEGGSLLLSFQPEDGYEVDEVSVNGAVVQHGGISYRVKDVTANTTVAVTFTQETKPEPDVPLVTVDVKVEVTAEGDRGGKVSPSGSFALAHGGSQTFHVFPEEGYDLDEVRVNGEIVQAEPLWSSTLSMARAAVGAAGGYRFSVDNVTDDTAIAVRFKMLGEGEPVPPPASVHTVTASASSGGMISPSGTAWVGDGGSISYTVKADVGWHLATLTVDDRNVTDQMTGNMFELSDVAGDAVVRAEFEANAADPEPPPYVTVHATSSKGGAVSPTGDVRVKTGESQTFAFVPEEGFVLDSVTVDGRNVIPIGGTYTLFDLVEDASIHATFREKLPDDPGPVLPEMRTVAATASTGGTVWPSGPTQVALGSSLLFAFAADEGYELDRVLLNGSEDVTDQVHGMTYRLANITEDCVISVLFKPTTEEPPKPDTFTITATAGDHGSITPEGAVEVDAGGSATFAMQPDDGYEVDSVLLDGRAVSAPGNSYTVSDVRSNMTLHVTFKKVGEPPTPTVTYAVTAAASEGGSIDPAGTFNVREGAAVTFSMQAEDGYRFASLVVNETDVTEFVRNGSYTLDDVREDTSVYARFDRAGAPIQAAHVITAFVSGGHGRVSPEGAVRVVSGSDQTFYFLPDEGYVVDAVTIDGQRLSWSPSRYRFEDVRANHVLAVSFKPISVPGGGNGDPVKSLARAITAKTGDGSGLLVSMLIAMAAGAAAVGIAARRRVQRAAGKPHEKCAGGDK